MADNDIPMKIEVNRRLMAQLLGGGMLATGIFSPARAQVAPPQASVVEMPMTMHQHPAGSPNAPKVTILVYPGMVLLDLVGPLTVFTIMGCKIELVWKDRNPVATDGLIPVTPTHDFAGASTERDIFMIPGGIIGTTACMNDPAVLAFVKAQGDTAKWVTSVCTGSLILAAAGLLKGYKATSLWAVVDMLPLMGATHIDERVVIDRNRITAGGVTAGIDFALKLAGMFEGNEVAKRIQLTIEYAPSPPYHAGTPAEVGPEFAAMVRTRRKGMDDAALAAARQAGARLGL